MELIELDATAQRALELLTNAGMSDGSIYDYTHTGFGSILRHFHTKGILYATAEMLDNFLLEQRVLLDQGDIHPHMMRHTRAMHLYQSGMPMVLLSQYLGHAQVETTMIYAYADTEMKRAAIQKADAVRGTKPVPDEIWADNEEMILKLSGLL